MGDIILAGLAVPEEEAIAVLGGQHHVLRPRGFCEAGPSRAAEVRWVELPVEVVVNLDGDRALVRAFGIGVRARPTDLGLLEAHGPPVDEEAKAPLRPPLEAFGIGTRPEATECGLGGSGRQGQTSNDLRPAAWTNVGSAQAGSDAPLVFTHVNGMAAGQRFYPMAVDLSSNSN